MGANQVLFYSLTDVSAEERVAGEEDPWKDTLALKRLKSTSPLFPVSGIGQTEELLPARDDIRHCVLPIDDHRRVGNVGPNHR